MLLPKKTILCGTQDTPVRVHLGLCIRWNVLPHDSDLALQITDNLGVHELDQATLTPMPSPDFIHQSLEREAVRRIFWLIHLLNVMASIYFKKPTTFTPSDWRLRLPVDETSLFLCKQVSTYNELPSLCTYWHIKRIPTCRQTRKWFYV